MRFATLALALIPAAFAAPIPAPAPGVLDSLRGLVGDILDGGDGATLPGVVDAVKDSIQRPDLLIARVQVVKGLGQTRTALQSIINDSAGGDNAAVGTAAQTALDGVEKAQGGVDSIGKAILSGATPERSDQATVAQGIIDAQAAIGTLDSAVTTPSDQLTQAIQSATDGVALMRKGGEGVLAASGLKFEDLGLGAPPAADSGAATPPPAASSSSAAEDVAAPPAASSTADAEAPVDTAAPVDQAPVEETPAAEDPATEDPATEDPVDETPADDTPAAVDNAKAVAPVRTPDLEINKLV